MERVNGDNVYFYGAAFSIPFPEVRGTEYFLEVTNLTDPEWGWHETNYCDYIDGGLCPILDYPAIGVPWDFPVWGTYCNGSNCNDLAFGLLQTPEPTSLLLLGGGLLAVRRRKK